jgi:hypothetical protein
MVYPSVHEVHLNPPVDFEIETTRNYAHVAYLGEFVTAKAEKTLQQQEAVASEAGRLAIEAA